MSARAPVRLVWLWLPPVAWTMAVLSFSGDGWSAANTGDVLVPMLGSLLPWATPEQILWLHGMIRKAAHVTEYAVLAALWFRALAVGTTMTSRMAAWCSVAICLTCAIVDEVHQSTIASRTGSAYDVALDLSATLAAATLVYLARRTSTAS